MVIIVITVVVWVKWDRWFYNPPEQAYSVGDEPARVLLTFGDIDGLTSRNISWIADTVVRPSCVQLVDLAEGDSCDIEAAGETFASRAGVAAYYVARLRSLKPGHCYRYRALTGHKASPWYEFAIADAHKPATTFLFVGDVQDTIAGVANRLLKRAISASGDIDFVVSGGDLVERPIDAYWAEGFRSVDSIAQTMPMLTVTGNHDYLKNIVRKLERRFTLIHSYFLDSKEDDNHVFTVRYGDVQLFALDSNRELPYLYAQSRWLERQLEASDARWKVVVLHHPLRSVKGKYNNMLQRWVFDDVIREHQVDLVLQGHEHAYARVTSHGTTPIYTISHCSPKNYRIKNEASFEKVGLGSRYYQKVRVAGDTLTITAYDANSGALYDSLQVVKHAEAVQVHDFGSRFEQVIIRE